MQTLNAEVAVALWQSLGPRKPALSPGKNSASTPFGSVPLMSRFILDSVTFSMPTLHDWMSSKTSTRQLVALGVVVRVSHGKLFCPYTQVRLTFTGHVGTITGADVGSDTGATVDGTGIIVGGTTGARVGRGSGAAVTGGGVMTGIIVGGTGTSVGSGTGAVVGGTVGGTGIRVGAAGASVGRGKGARVGGGTGAGVARLSST